MQKTLENTSGLTFQKINTKEDRFFFSRRDYKFLIPSELIQGLLDFLKQDYDCLCFDNSTVFGYRNTYYDTENLDFFNHHRKGKYNRVKVRIREYLNSDAGQFLEIKRKVKGSFTRKEREILENPEALMKSSLLTENLSRHGFFPEDLVKQTKVSYERMNFAAKDGASRISIDYNINAETPDGKYADLIPGYMVLEVKADKYPKQIGTFLKRNYGIRQTSFSKYCLAICLLEENAKKNNWKSIINKYH